MRHYVAPRRGGSRPTPDPRGGPGAVCHNGRMPTREQVLDALRAVIDPELRRDIVELEMVRSIDIHPNGVIDVMVSLTTSGCPIRNTFQTGVSQAVRGLDGVTAVNVSFDVLSDNEKQALGRKLGRNSLPEGALAQVKNVICIGSGKGGVGKSSVTANMAAALAAGGKRVGVLDADVWGCSQPRMLGLGAERPKVNGQRKILPLEAHDGIKVMSIGFFVEEDSAVVWRGPMLHKALQQFLEDVEWGDSITCSSICPRAPATCRRRSPSSCPRPSSSLSPHPSRWRRRSPGARPRWRPSSSSRSPG